jgi:ParB/RepB/Spo0J family partition protein
MELEIADVRVGNRKRKLNESKVQSLAESFCSIGQLQPITVARKNGSYKLIAGLHRLEAAKSIGWRSIQATEFEGDEVAVELAEIDENLMRNDLTVLEQGEHLARRQELVGYKVGKPNPATVAGLKTTNEIAKEIGISERSAYNRMQVARNIVPEVKEAIRETEIANSTTQLLELARLAPEKQVEVAKSITDGAASIADAFKSINKEKRERMHAEKRTRELPAGKYAVIYADPPWRYDNSGFNEAADNQYPTMPLDEICELPIGDLADQTTVLFLWATNPLLPEALQVMASWGFEYKTNIAWIKDAGRGKGWYLKSKHELLLIGVKSETPHPIERHDSCFEAGRGNVHSRKPEKAYEIIESMYPGNKVELFARNRREGWDIWGNEQ